jgi:IS5 family transposase
MRKRFETQIELGQVPIGEVKIPTKSRDELPPVLAALQWIYTTPEINEQIFEILEKRINKDKKYTGRPGMDLWHVLVLGVIRLTLDCDYDRLEYIAHYDNLTRQIMGLENSFCKGDITKGFHHKTISENVYYIDEEMLQQINEIVAKEGRRIIKKNEKIKAKADTYVLETNVHFPTDMNLLWDASRKCIELLFNLSESLGLGGWRKAKDWKKQIKGLMRLCGRINKGGGKNKAERLKNVVMHYIEKAKDLEKKVERSIRELQLMVCESSDLAKIEEVRYFHEMLIKHIDMLDRRVIHGEKISHEEKVFSLFEPHTKWINKGKLYPSMELGHKLLITTDQNEIVIDYKVMQQSVDNKETLELSDRLFKKYGEDQIARISFDKGFSNQETRELLKLYIPEVVMPKQGRLNKEEKAIENQKRFKELRNKHSAIESSINSLEHHGLNRCPDKGINGFKRYVGLGILAYNLHKIGNYLLKKHRMKLQKAA